MYVFIHTYIYICKNSNNNINIGLILFGGDCYTPGASL